MCPGVLGAAGAYGRSPETKASVVFRVYLKVHGTS